MTDTSTYPDGTQDDGVNFRRVVVWIARALTYVVYAYVLIVQIILLLGFLLLLFGANPTSSFVQWAYRNLNRAMEPFRGIFSPIELGTTGNDVPAVFDSSIVFAMVIYAILAIALSSLIHWLTGRLQRIDYQSRSEQAREDAIIQAQALRDRATIIEAQRAEAARLAALAEQNAAQAAVAPAAAATPAPSSAPAPAQPAPGTAPAAPPAAGQQPPSAPQPPQGDPPLPPPAQ